MTRAMLITHTHTEAPADATSAAVAAAAKAASEASVRLISTADELRKHGDAAAGIEAVEDGERPDVCIVLGGDGSILYALRRFARTDVPVFGINYGTVGFLAAVERDHLEDGLRRAFSGDFVSLDMPALRADLPIERPLALNDFSFNRRPSRSGRGALLRDRRRGGRATCAATGWWPRPRPARLATTSRTPGRSSRGA